MSPFEAWIREYMMRYGEPPELRTSKTDYDYARALLNGIQPARYEIDGMYHWPSRLEDGQQLKKQNHPTRWMEDFVQAFGWNPQGLIGERLLAEDAIESGQSYRKPTPLKGLLFPGK